MDLERPFRGSEAVARGDLTPGRLRGPAFVPLGHDVYVAAGTPVDRVTLARAAMLRHPDGTVTGTAAAVLWGAGAAVADAAVTADLSGRTEVLVPGAGVRSRGALDVRRAHLPEDEVVTWPDGSDGAVLRLTSPRRTVLEIARRLPTVEAVVIADALAGRCGVSTADVVALADRHTGERGMARVRATAALMDPRTGTPRRTRVRLGVLSARLPAPMVGAVVTVAATEEVVGELDLAWPASRGGVLVDRGPEDAWARAGALLDRGWEVVSLGAVGEHPVPHVVERIVAFSARLDRLRWRDVPDMRGRYPRRPSAPRLWT